MLDTCLSRFGAKPTGLQYSRNLLLHKIILNCDYVWSGDGVVAKGPAYGMSSIRVDGNDTLAIYATIKAARKIAVEESRPVLIEVMNVLVNVTVIFEMWATQYQFSF